MRLKFDENMPTESVAILRQLGHDVPTAVDQGYGGRPDEDIADLCRREGRVLVTLDTDFGDIRRFPPDQSPGIILLRPSSNDVVAVNRAVELFASRLDIDPLAGYLWVVSDTRIRIFPTPPRSSP